MTNRELIQQQALEEATKHKRCGLGISMGVGKTRIGIQHLQKNYNSFIKALIVIPKLAIKKSWLDELEKMNLQTLENHIEFVTYISLNKKNPNEYDLLYLDECHNLLESHDLFLSNFKGKILGLTGTPPVKKFTEKYKMVSKYCPIKYTFSIDDATDSNILNDYRIIIHELELSKLKTLKKNKKDGGYWFTSEHDDYAYSCHRLAIAVNQKQMQMSSIHRMRGIMDYTTKELYVKSLLQNMTEKCIIFANTQDQADKICKHSYHANNLNSEDNLQKFNDGRITQLSCVLQLSEGITIPNLKQGIIMHAYGNERKTAQRIGRLLRLNPNEKATCHILSYKDTVDNKWVQEALTGFDQSKIIHYNPLSK